MDWKIGVRAHDYGKRPLNELVAMIANDGFGYIQLALTKAITDFQYSYGMLSSGAGKTIRRELEKHDLRVSVLGCYIDPSTNDKDIYKHNLKIFKEHLRFAHEIGASMVATETGNFTDKALVGVKVVGSEQFNTVANFVEEVVNEAEKVGTKVAIESVLSNTINCAQTMKALLQRINSPSLCALVDTVNMTASDDIEEHRKLIDEIFSLYGDRINAFHVKDFSMVEGKKHRRSIGEGVFDNKYLLEKIRTYKPFCDILIEDSIPEESKIKIALIKGLLNSV